jgi:hypothetical protein
MESRRAANTNMRRAKTANRVLLLDGGSLKLSVMEQGFLNHPSPPPQPAFPTFFLSIPSSLNALHLFRYPAFHSGIGLSL